MKSQTPEYQPIDPFKAWSAMASATTRMLQAQARVFNSFLQSSSTATKITAHAAKSVRKKSASKAKRARK